MKTYAKHKQCGILLQLLQHKYRISELESQLAETWLRDYKDKRFFLIDGLLYHRLNHTSALTVVDRDHISLILQECHVFPYMAHMSEDRTKERVASTAWWPKGEQELSEYINTCEICQKENRKNGKKYGLLQHIEEPKNPWETINMDWVTGLVPGAHHPQTDGLAERMIQTMEDIIRKFFAYGIEYKCHEGYTHDWVTLLPEKNLLTIHPTAKDFHDMWERACDTASRLIPEEKEYNKQRWDESNMEPDFKEGDQLIGKNSVEIKLTEEFSRKHPVFPVSLVKPYFQTEGDRFPSRKRNLTPPEVVEMEDSPGPVRKRNKARKIRLNGKEQRQYWFRFKNQTADEDKCLEEDAIQDGSLPLRQFSASRRTEKYYKL
ncbi:hypothetical protein O181_043980 [Austropuccinia psidii MF-1]|uniref:Integrase zinc-binding domain-containing protein n=1 Tax=Austropuccinia psidii MF-1 TaxID=1389203 RepID=A0A9Q3HJR4_9BASI|nr:hypothetical protein [Austropuccinia psidii MF-1]